jgi:hypothetical protein
MRPVAQVSSLDIATPSFVKVFRKVLVQVMCPFVAVQYHVTGFVAHLATRCIFIHFEIRIDVFLTTSLSNLSASNLLLGDGMVLATGK